MSGHLRFRRDAEIESARRPAADTRPDPGTLETIGAGFRVAQDESPATVEIRLQREYGDLARELAGGGDAAGSTEGFLDKDQFGRDNFDKFSPTKIWAEITRRRQADPRAFAELGTQEEFEREVLRRGEGRSEDLDVLRRGGGVAGFVGGVGGSFTDPNNIVFLPFGGGGKTVATRVLSEGLANAGIEALQTSSRAAIRERLGEELTREEALLNIAAAGVGGAAIRGGIEVAPAVGRGVGRAIDNVIDRATGGALTDMKLARAFAQQVPVELRTPDQQAALDVLTRQSLIEEATPFVRTIDADDVHAAKLTEAMAALEAGRVPAGRVPGNRAVGQGARAVSRPVAGSGASGGPFDMAGFLARTRVAESGGSDAAAAQTSSAFGRFQFLKDTWLEFYRKTFGDTGESKAQILGKRADGSVQDQVMEVFTRANIRSLERAGVPVRDNTVYLAHFLGPKDAIAVMRAAPGTPVAQVVSRAAIKANPGVFDEVRTAGDLAQWAAGKFDGSNPATPAARSSSDEVLAALDAEEAALDARQAALGEVDVTPAPLASRSASLDPAGIGDPTGQRLVEAELAARARGDDPAADPLFRLREVVIDRDGGRSLNRARALAQELGMSEPQLRDGLKRLAALGEIKQNANGNFSRLPRPSGRREDLLLFIARQGGITPDGLRAPDPLNPSARLATSRGHDLRNTGSLNHFVPAGGPLLRATGKSLDEIGELIHEAGFLGPPGSVVRPTDSEVIDLLDRVISNGERLFPEGLGVAEARKAAREPGGVPRGFQDREEFDSEFARHNRAAMTALGRELTEEEFLDLVNAERLPLLPDFEPEFLTEALWESGDLLVPRVMAWVNRQLDEAIEDAFYETEDEIYAELAEQFAESTAETAGRQVEGGGAGRAGQAADAGDAGQGGARAGAGPGDGGQAQLNPRQSDAAQAAGLFGPPVENPALARVFDADDGPGVRQIAESDWHDIRAELIDGAPSRPTAALLEAGDTPKFDLDDGLGPRTAAEIDAEISADRGAIDAIRACLK